MCRFELSTKHRVARGEEDCLRAVDGRLESFGRLRTGRHLIGIVRQSLLSTSLQDLRMPAAVPSSGSATVDRLWAARPLSSVAKSGVTKCTSEITAGAV